MNIQDIKRELADSPDRDLGSGVDEQAVLQAESALGVLFPPQYRRFLARFGSGFVSSEEFIGLGGPRHLDVAWLTIELRSRKKDFPKSLIPIRADGFGNYDCLDSNNPTSDGEFPVVVWVHDGGANQHHRILAPSFDDWFINMLRLVKELDANEE